MMCETPRSLVVGLCPKFVIGLGAGQSSRWQRSVSGQDGRNHSLPAISLSQVAKSALFRVSASSPPSLTCAALAADRAPSTMKVEPGRAVSEPICVRRGANSWT